MSTTTSTSGFSQEVASDIKTIFGLVTGSTAVANLNGLKTVEKANLVLALNELYDSLGDSSGGGALIDDSDTSLVKVWSSSKVSSAVSELAGRLDAIVNASPAAYDTFKEIADYISNDQSGAAAMTAAIQNRLRLDVAQTFTAEQLTQGLANLVTLGVAKQTDLAQLRSDVGDTTVNFRNVYIAARDS